jgi:hypothetical protein
MRLSSTRCVVIEAEHAQPRTDQQVSFPPIACTSAWDSDADRHITLRIALESKELPDGADLQSFSKVDCIVPTARLISAVGADFLLPSCSAANFDKLRIL